MGKHHGALGGQAEQRQLAGGVAARRHEAIHALEHERLLARQRRRVDSGLGQGVAAVEHQAGQREAVVAAKTGAAVTRGHADRAEEARVVQVEHHRRAGGAGGGQAPRTHERLHVVGVDHVGAELARRRGQLLLVLAPAQHRRGRPELAGVAGVPLEQAVLHPRVPQRTRVQLQRALLATFDPVAVVHEQNAGGAVSGHWSHWAS